MHLSSTARYRTGGSAGPPSPAYCVERLDIAIRRPSGRRPEAKSCVGEGENHAWLPVHRSQGSSSRARFAAGFRTPWRRADPTRFPVDRRRVGPLRIDVALLSQQSPLLPGAPISGIMRLILGVGGLAPGGSCNSKGSWPVGRGPLCSRCGGADCSLPLGVGAGRRGRRIPFEPLAKCRGFVISSTG